MNGLADLIKHVTISRPLTWASFLSSIFILSTRKWFHSISPGIPENWIWTVKLMTCFSGFLIFAWYWPGILNSIQAARRNSLLFDRLSAGQRFVLQACATVDGEVLPLHNVIKKNCEYTLVELLVITKSLVDKDYLHNPGYNEYVIALTEKGRRFVCKNYR